MAVKKTTTKKEESAAPTKVEAKETAPKKTSKAKAAAPVVEAPAPVPVPAPEPAKAAKPKATPKAKAAAPKKAAPIKLTASQGDLLKRIGGATEAGYVVDKKIELRSIESLLEKKLIKKGAKDKATGKVAFHISSSGKKYAEAP